MNDINEIKSSLKDLISLPGISGHEEPIAQAVSDLWRPYADEVIKSKIGNIYACQKGTGDPDGKHRRVAIAVHMDGIGMIVHSIKGEFLTFAPVGGFDPRILPGQFVTVHAKGGDIPGLIVQPAANLTKSHDGSKPVPMDELLIDLGLDTESVREKVSVGDTISYANAPVDIPDDCVAGHSLDNRASVAALTVCLKELQKIRHQWDVYAVGTVQEETSFLGGATAPYDIRPDVCIAVDVTFAKGPGSTDWRTVPLESGASLGFGMNIHPKLYEICKDICEERDIPYTSDMLPGMSGTDGDPMQISSGGYPTMVISIPLRYMHTPVEIISMKDVMHVGHLLALLIASMDENFMDKLAWED